MLMILSLFWYISKVLMDPTTCPTFKWFHSVTRKASIVAFSLDDLNVTNRANISFSTYGILYCSFNILGLFSEILLLEYADVLVLMISLTLWAPSIQFSKLVRKNNSKTKKNYCNLQIYKEIKQLSDLVNEAFQKLMLTYTLDGLFFNATTFMDVVTGKWFYRILRTYSFANITFVSYFAADAARQVLFQLINKIRSKSVQH